MKNKTKLTIVFLFILFSLGSEGRSVAGEVSKKTHELFVSGREFKVVQPFKSSNGLEPLGIRRELNNYTCLEVDKEVVLNLVKYQPEYIELKIPESSTSDKTLLLYKKDIASSSFELMTERGFHSKGQDIVHYRGIIKGDTLSIASFSFSVEETIGLFSDSSGNNVVGKLNKEGRYVMYGERDMRLKIPFECDFVRDDSTDEKKAFNPNQTQPLSTKCINTWLEVDYDFFVLKGSDVSAVNTHIQGVFNQVSTLYDNDGITVNLSTIYVWTSVDPFVGPSSLNYLYQFSAIRQVFNGDVAQLLGVYGNGGNAFLDKLCKPTNKLGYSRISSGIYQVVPIYSWTVAVITHEQGHILGSPHTHDCVWNGDSTQIDGCGGAVGCIRMPIPYNSGTIMSYCHYYNSMNFSYGFGPQPLNLILSKINAATCLSNSCSPCFVPTPDSIIGPERICKNSTATAMYACAPVLDAVSYTWTLPTGWSGFTSGDTMFVTVIGESGEISVKANYLCGTSTEQKKNIEVGSSPMTPGVIIGNRFGVCNSNQTYSLRPVLGNDYTWSVTGGNSNVISGQGTDSIIIYFGVDSASSTIQVIASNFCGVSNTRTQTIKMNPASPKRLIGNANPCSGQQNVQYSISPVYGANYYEWKAPYGSHLNDGLDFSTNNIFSTVSTQIFVDFGLTINLGINVKSINHCGESPVKSLQLSFGCRYHQNMLSGESYGIESVYPNPARENINIVFNSTDEKDYSVEIYDMNNRMLKKDIVFINKGINYVNLNTNDLSCGTYFLRLSNGFKLFQDRFSVIN